MSNTGTAITRAQVRAALKAGGVPVGRVTDRDTASVVDFTDWVGVKVGVAGSDASPDRVDAALAAAGLPVQRGVYRMIPRDGGRLTVAERDIKRTPVVGAGGRPRTVSICESGCWHGSTGQATKCTNALNMAIRKAV